MIGHLKLPTWGSVLFRLDVNSFLSAVDKVVDVMWEIYVIATDGVDCESFEIRWSLRGTHNSAWELRREGW